VLLTALISDTLAAEPLSMVMVMLSPYP
jgi:hypothetical protein